MELKLEIKFASVEELSIVAKALTGLKVEAPKASPSKEAEAPKVVAEPAAVETIEEAKEVKAKEVKAKEVKAPALSAAEKKAEKKAQEEADKADRIARLKASMDSTLGPSHPSTQAATEAEDTESPEAIAEEIKSLGDKLMSFSGMHIEAKQQLTIQVAASVGVPQGVRPSQLSQPMLGNFRDAYRVAVNSVVNPVMGGLV